MKRKGHVGRPSLGDEALTEIHCIRLSKDEKDAIKQLEINFAELARKALAQAIADKKFVAENFPKAS
jgi:hypothetical protein